MPTRAEQPPREGNIGILQESSRSWTDDLPVCHLTGVGLSTNQIYREDGQRREQHPCEDRSFHFRVDNEDDSTVFFYGVFSGHEGIQAANFATQRMPAEVLLGQLKNKNNDKDVKDVLLQAFIAVETGFFESIDDVLAEKAKLQMELPEGINSYAVYQKYPDIVNKLQQINAEIGCGTSAVLALIYHNSLYIANVGDSRALLCTSDKENGLRVTQLSVDHDLRNDDELLRLSQLGLDIDKVRQSSKLGNQQNTRCIGNYIVKGEYKDIDILKDAKGEPVTAEPDIHGGIAIDSSFNFLLLMSDGLYKVLEEATNTRQSNEDIARMVADQFHVQSTLTGVAQAVVDKVVRIHHDTYMQTVSSGVNTSGAGGCCEKRDDITLLVRNFSCQLSSTPSSTPMSARVSPNMSFGSSRFGPEFPSMYRQTSIASTTSANSSVGSVPGGDHGLLSPIPQSAPLSGATSPNHPPVQVVAGGNGPAGDHVDAKVPAITSASPESMTPQATNRSATQDTGTGTAASGETAESSETTTSSSESGDRQPTSGQTSQLSLDKEARVKAYVDFSDFYIAVKEAQEKGELPPP